MRAIEARKIPIVEYLTLEGITYIRSRRDGGELWYSSPLRDGDSDPSFKVDTAKNLWFDFGLDKGGNVIDLVCALRNTTVSDALRLLEETGLYRGVYLPGANSALFQPEYPAKNKADFVCAGEKENQLVGELSSIGRGRAENKSPGRFEIKKVIKLTHPALIEYLGERKIDIAFAKKYLKEVHFKPNDQNKSFFALGWKCGGGYDVRNRHFKGFVGQGKDISTINLRKGEAIYIFEGWMDFLSYLTLHDLKDFKNAALILHSTALRKRAVELIKENGIKRANLFLDNDQAGLDAVEYFNRALPNIQIFDRSHLYKPAKDLNERLMGREKK